MLKRMRAASVGFALLVVSAAAFAQDTFDLSYTNKVGDVHKTKVVVKFSIQGADVTLEELGKDEITEVKPDGTYTQKTSLEGGKISVMGMDQDIPPTAGDIVTRDKWGKLLSLKITDTGMPASFTPEINKLLTGLSEVIFAGKAVKAGDSWDVSWDNPAAKGKKVTVKSTLVGTEKLNGKDVVKIKQSGEGATDEKDGKMKVEFTAWVDPKSGRTLKMEGKATDVPSAQTGGNLTFDMVVVDRA